MVKSGSSFLLAARRCEICELEQLALTGELVNVIGRFIHALQKERGLSIVFLLVFKGAHPAAIRTIFITDARACRTSCWRSCRRPRARW